MIRNIGIRLGLAAMAVACGFISGPVDAQMWAVAADAPPLKHPKIVNPATLSSARAETVYQAIRPQIRNVFARTGDPTFVAYQSWRRYNRTPYRSQAHGERFVNHYANATAAGYGKFEGLDALPTGAIIIKDSFVVTKSGGLMAGPLFMMEKMEAGFESLAGRWRFLMLRPDGTLFGMTGGDGDANVRFCAECHREAGATHDFLHFMPREVRIRN